MFTLIRTKTLAKLREQAAMVKGYERRVEAAIAEAGGDKDRASVRRMIAKLKGGATFEAVDAGPVPENSDPPLQWYRIGQIPLVQAFVWDSSKQGYKYWRSRKNLSYNTLDPEARAIIDAWCAKLEGRK